MIKKNNVSFIVDFSVGKKLLDTFRVQFSFLYIQIQFITFSVLCKLKKLEGTLVLTSVKFENKGNKFLFGFFV